MNRKFISKSNYVLRKVLNSNSNLDIIQDFIETFLHINIKNIILNPYLKSKAKYLPAEENFGIADVRIQKDNNEEINVGIQIVDGIYVQNKLLLYYAQLHANQLEHKEYKKIAKTITINMLDFKYFSSKQYHKKLLIKDNHENGYKPESLELHVLELPKFNGSIKDVLNKEETWMMYLSGKNQSKIDEITKNNSSINKLNTLLENYWKEEKME